MDQIVEALKRCRDLLGLLNTSIGTFTAMDIERDLGGSFLDDVEDAVASADAAIAGCDRPIPHSPR